MFFERRCVCCDSIDGPVCGLCEQRLSPANVASLESIGTVGASGVRSAFALDGASRPIVTALKYRRERRLARWAGVRVVPLVPTLADVVTWVPATPERVRWRGYDQSQEIATEVGRAMRVPVRRLLARDRSDHRQTNRTRGQRSLGPALRATRKSSGLVAVIDDVVTTGASLAVAAERIRESGADRIVAVTLFHSQRRTPLGSGGES